MAERDETKESDYGYVLRVSGPLIVGTAMVSPLIANASSL
jgi:hypothetical protein